MHGDNRQTVRQDYYSNTALCTKVHCAVKKKQKSAFLVRDFSPNIMKNRLHKHHSLVRRSAAKWERWGCRTGHCRTEYWRTDWQGWALQDWTSDGLYCEGLDYDRQILPDTMWRTSALSNRSLPTPNNSTACIFCEQYTTAKCTTTLVILSGTVTYFPSLQ